MLRSYLFYNILNNGSFGLVDTGEKKLLVTCHHVWHEFQAARREKPEMRLCIALSTQELFAIDPIEPIDEDERLDIATFDAPLFPRNPGQSMFSRLDCGNVSRLRKGDRLVLIGFRGRIKAETRIGVQFLRAPYTLSVSDVTNSFLAVNMRNIKPISQIVPSPEDIKADNLRGGISGSPCYLLRQNGLVELVAFATSEVLEILQLTLARCLNPDGTIARA